MTHHISRVGIRNFKSIKSVELQLGCFSPIIGQNNVGKSNILNAINWLIKPGAVESTYFNSEEKPIEVEAVIEGITEELLQDNLYKKHAERVTPFLQERRLVIKRILPAHQTRASEAKIHVRNPANGEFEVNPAGIDAALKNLFPEPVRIEAMVDAPEDVAKNKSTSTLGKIIALLTEPVSKKHGAELEKLLEQLGDCLSASGSNRADELKAFDAEASRVLQSFFPGLEILIDFPTPNLPDLLKSGTVKVKEGATGSKREFAELGHGAQRCIQMAMVQLLAIKSQGSEVAPRCTLLLIDEPELYLHPQAIEQVRVSLKRLAQAGYQVIFSTHSPLFVGRNDVATANIIFKRNSQEGTTANRSARDVVTSILAGDAARQGKTLFELSNAKELLFSERVLLVEGHTEPEVVPRLYEHITGRTLAADKIGVVRLSSCGDMKKAMDILAGMGIAACALVDLDYAFVGGAQAHYIQKDHPARLAVQNWFLANHVSHGMVLENGWPTKRSKGGAEGAFQIMAGEAANAASIRQLHQELLAHNIWSWPKGSFEQMVGIAQKNDPDAIAEICEKLGQADSKCLANWSECEAFCKWLQGAGVRAPVSSPLTPPLKPSGAPVPVAVGAPELRGSQPAPVLPVGSLTESNSGQAKPTRSFRVLHTADWHLGKMLGEHSREEEHQRFLSFLLDQIRQLSVDALIIAGDVFDSANPAQSAAAQYYNFLSALYRQGGCSVVIVAGNHDSPGNLEAPRQVLKALGAHVLGTLPASLVDLVLALPSPESPQVVVAAVPFLRDRDLRLGQSGQSASEIQRELVRGISRRYKEAAEAADPWAKKGSAILATGHLTVVGCSTCESEREIHVGGLGAVGCDCFPDIFSYVALGHLHRPQCGGRRETIRYSGSPIPLGFSEASDQKEVRLLDFSGGKLVQQAGLQIPVSRQLAQIRCKRASLETELKQFQRKRGSLPAWVEVIVEDPVPGENLYDLARSCVTGNEYEVIRVLGARTKPLSGTSAGDQPPVDGVEGLLGDPSKVFEHRLEEEPALGEEDRTALKTVFKELCNLHQEEQREPARAGGEAIGGEV